MTMTIAQQIGRMSTNVETNIRANEFLSVARALLATRTPGEAERFLQRIPASDRTKQVFETRAAVAAGTVSDSTWGGAVSPFNLASDAFGETIRNSAFDRVLNDGSFLRVPPMTRVAVTTAGASGYVVGETAPKPASQLTMTAVELSMSKVAAYVVISQELMRGGSTGALNLLGRELRGALAVVTDTYFISQLTTGLTAIPSAGSSAVAIRNDIRFLMDAISFGADARLYFIAPPQIAKRLATVGDSTGGKMFAGLTPTGGVLDGIPFLTSDSAASGTLTLADMSQVAAAGGPIELDRSDAATLVLDSAPSSPPVVSDNYQSLWQLNQSALRAERYLSVQRMRSTAVATLSGVTGLGNSPA
jgi:HK97 family phage major capsid protein